MTDNMDIVEYLRLWASPDPDNQEVRDLHRAADEIERLRKENQRLRLFAEDLETAAEIDRVRLSSRILQLEQAVRGE